MNLGVVPQQIWYNACTLQCYLLGSKDPFADVSALDTAGYFQMSCIVQASVEHGFFFVVVLMNRSNRVSEGSSLYLFQVTPWHLRIYMYLFESIYTACIHTNIHILYRYNYTFFIYSALIKAYRCYVYCMKVQ